MAGTQPERGTFWATGSRRSSPSLWSSASRWRAVRVGAVKNLLGGESFFSRMLFHFGDTLMLLDVFLRDPIEGTPHLHQLPVLSANARDNVN